ncbi:MAG: HlyC/CorC family transporter [Pseudomonadota bacterium]|nr:HlyC/CorC family transporter [Pseudomonadota bacterium]
MDTLPLSTLFLALFALFLLSAFFSGSETALIALNRYRLRHLARTGHGGAERAQQLLENPGRLITLILLGNNFVNIVITQVATYLGYRLYGDAGIAIATGVLTLTLLIFAEITPKTLAAVHSEKFAFPAAWVYTPLSRFLYPIVWLLTKVSSGLIRLFGVSPEGADSHALSREELRVVVTEAGGMIPREHREMLVGILDLEKAIVQDIMVPRNEITGIDLEDDWEQVLTELHDGHFSRIPVYRGSIDNVAGFLHVRKVLPLLSRDELTPEELEKAIGDPHFIPEGTSLSRQLLNFRMGRQRSGLVVDEYGDIQGLVTLEDLLEEIVGEFTSDPSAYDKDILPQGDGSYIVDGGTHIRDLNRSLGWQLPDSGPRTINGLVTEHMEFIPAPGTSLMINGYPVEVIQTKANAVITVRIRPKWRKTKGS